MKKKKKTWLEIKATKEPEEWRRLNRIYSQRRRLRNQLRLKAAELLNQIHAYRLVHSPGIADALIDEVRKTLRLPYCWSQEDYDHAEAHLNEIEKQLRKIKRSITPKASELANIIMMNLINSKDDDSVKATALVGAMEYVAARLSTEKVETLENSTTNYIMTLLRTKDGYYPKWMVKSYYNSALQLFSEDDIKQLATMFAKVAISYRERAALDKAIEMEKKDEIEIG